MKDLTQYGCRLNFYKWSTQTLYQTVDLGLDGFTPLEIRFLHDPKRPDGFVGCALNAKVFYFKKKPDSDEFDVKKVIDIPEKLVDTGSGTASKMGGMISDIIISLDDRFLYVNCWRHGDVRQYDITNPEEPKLISQVFLGGAICNDLPNVIVHEDRELKVSKLEGRSCNTGAQVSCFIGKASTTLCEGPSPGRWPPDDATVPRWQAFVCFVLAVFSLG